VKRVLIRPGAIGDFIVSLPALEHLAAAASYTEVWVTGRNLPLVRFADRVRSISSTGLDLLELGQAPLSLHETLAGFDEIWSWYGFGRAAFQESVRHLPVRVFPALPDSENGPATDFYLRQVGAPPGAVPRIDCPRQDKGYTVIHPFSGSARKNWPLEKFRALAGDIGRRMPVAWCAGPEEDLPEARRFEDLYDLACWLAQAHLYIGNDSGITHLAAAVGVPVVALFGETLPQVWAPRGDNVKVLRNVPLKELPVQAVIECIQWG